MKNRSFLFYLVLVTICSVSNAQNAEKDFQEGYKLFREAKYEPAIIAFQKAVASSGVRDCAYPLLLKSYYLAGKYTEVVQCSEEAQKWLKDDLDILYWRAQAWCGLKNWESAISDLSLILQRYPNNVFVRYSLGFCYQSQQKPDMAIQEYQTVLKETPFFALAYQRLGECFVLQKKWHEARQNLDEALRLRPDIKEIYYYRAQVASALNESTNAIEDLRKTVESNPTHVEALLQLGVLYQEQKRYEDAMSVYEKLEPLVKEEKKESLKRQKAILFYYTQQYNEALKLLDEILAKSPDKESYYYQGMVYKSKKQEDKALESFDKASQIDGKYWPAALEKIQILSEKGPYQVAIEECKNVIDMGYEGFEPYFYRGNARQQIKEYERSLADYYEALQRKPGYAEGYAKRSEARRKLAGTKLEPDRTAIFTAALKDIDQAIAFDPNQAKYYNQKGILYFTQDQFEKAIPEFDQAIRLSPDTAEFYYNRGQCNRGLKKLNEAVSDILKAVEKKPDRFDSHYNLGVLYFQLKQDEKALASFVKAIQLNPDSALAYFQRGLVYRRLSKYQEALADMTKAINLKPEKDMDTFHYYRGLIYHAIKQYPQALEDSTRALTLNPNKKNYYVLRARIFEQLGEKEKAETDTKRAQELPE